MTDYSKSVNFAVKDTLASGDPNKIVSGAELDNEFNNIASASTTKIDKVPAADTGNLARFTATGAIEDSSESTATIIAAASSPAGSVIAFAGTSAPNGWLECDGSNVSRSTYSDLFDAIGTNFGAGDGTSTFGLPDLRGEFIRGWDNGRGVDSGRSFGSSQLDQIQKITGQVTADKGGLLNPSGAFSISGSQQIGDGLSGPGKGNALFFDSSGSVRSGDETRPRNVALMYIIKT